MRFSVTGQPRLLGEGLSANIANVGSLACVNEQVLPKSVPSGKGLCTHGTRIRFYACMRAHMDFQVVRDMEHLPALFADNPFLGLMPVKVLFESFLGDKSSFAYFAHVLWFLVDIFYVGLQGVEIFTLVTTYVAYYGGITAVHLVYMLFQIILYLKWFGAKFTRELIIVRVLSDKVILQCPFFVALVIAYTALVHLWSVNFIRMIFKLPFQTVSIRADRALVSMLLYVRRQLTFTEVCLSAHVALKVFCPDNLLSVYADSHFLRPHFAPFKFRIRAAFALTLSRSSSFVSF